MKLNTAQVAEKLGISKLAVRKLRDEGKLKDIKERGEGKSKHFSLFDSVEVNAFAKTYRANGGPKRGRPARHAETTSHTHGAQPTGLGLATPASFSSRLERLEKKIDLLVEIWTN
jgi:hypothetical protein